MTIGKTYPPYEYEVGREKISTNQDGAEVVRGTWTNIVRGG
jgi:hypothetical protein